MTKITLEYISGQPVPTTRERAQELDRQGPRCDCCGKLKSDCEYIWASYVGDTYACAICRGEEDEEGEIAQEIQAREAQL